MNNFLKRIILLIAWVPLNLIAQDATQHFLSHPLRMVGGYRVDLQPLCSWWPDAQIIQDQIDHMPKNSTNRLSLPPRPLTGWVRVYGSEIHDLGIGWTISARIERIPGKPEWTKIFLRHPPVAERQRFNELRSGNERFTGLSQTAYSASSLNSEIAQENFRKAETINTVRSASPYLDNQLSYRASQYSGAGSAATVRSANQSRIAAAASTRAAEAQAELRHFPPGDSYTVDFFALKTVEMYAGLPVYDLGMLIGPP